MANRISGSLNINVLLAFTFGVIFVSVMLLFAVFFENPSSFAQTIFIIVIGLAAAGVAAVIPGMLDINLPYAKAGGALAVFVLIFTTEPAIVRTVAIVKPPNFSPEPMIETYLKAVDEKHTDTAWSMFSKTAQRGAIKTAAEYKDLYNSTRYQFGELSERKKIGAQEAISPNGMPLGAYFSILYQTKFSGGTCVQESVTTISTDGKNWGIFGHTIDNSLRQCI